MPPPTPTPWAPGNDATTVCSQRRPSQHRTTVAKFERPEDRALCLKAVNGHVDLTTALDNLCDEIVKAGINLPRYAGLNRAYHIGRKAVAEAKT